MKRGYLWFSLVCLSLGASASPLRAQVGVGDVRLGIYAGPAFRTGAATRPYNVAVGAEADVFRVGRVVAGGLAEGGTYHPVISGAGNYYFSADATLGQVEAPFADAAMGVRPFAVAGYTRFFNANKTEIGTADAVNCGLGLDRALKGGLKDDLRLRLEVRVYETPASNAHAIEIRIGIVAVGSLD